MRNKMIATATLGALALVGSNAFAQTTGNDYSAILSGLDTSTAITAIVGAGALLAGVGFARWATKKVARFFG
jgi:hypothetical protein